MNDTEYGRAVQAIANEFRLLMQEHCMPLVLENIDRYNNKGWDDYGCASHELTPDPGPEPLMHQAFLTVMGRSADLSALDEPMDAGLSEDDCKLWEDAWMRAKEDGYSEPVRSLQASDLH
jgi:hypothetical protein